MPQNADRASLMSAEELLRLDLPHKRTELVGGVLVVREPVGYRHGDVAARLLIAVGAYVNANRLGRVFAAETGFTLARNPDTVRAAEVLSPDDQPGKVLAKVADWLTAGTRLVWIVDPAREIARVYRADGTESIVSEAGALLGEDVLPGFEQALSAIVRPVP